MQAEKHELVFQLPHFVTEAKHFNCKGNVVLVMSQQLFVEHEAVLKKLLQFVIQKSFLLMNRPIPYITTFS